MMPQPRRSPALAIISGVAVFLFCTIAGCVAGYQRALNSDRGDPATLFIDSGIVGAIIGSQVHGDETVHQPLRLGLGVDQRPAGLDWQANGEYSAQRVTFSHL